MHAFDRGVSLASNSDGLAKVLTRNPEAETNLFNERSNDGSSSTTNTVAGLIVRTALVARSLDLTLPEVFADGLTAAAFLARFVMILIFGSRPFRLCYGRMTCRNWTKGQCTKSRRPAIEKKARAVLDRAAEIYTSIGMPRHIEMIQLFGIALLVRSSACDLKSETPGVFSHVRRAQYVALGDRTFQPFRAINSE